MKLTLTPRAVSLIKEAAARRFEEMQRDPALAFERRRSLMLMTMLRSVSYKDTGSMLEAGVLPEEYLIERGFTKLEVKDLLPSCLVILQTIFLEHPEVFEAIADAKKEDKHETH